MLLNRRPSGLPLRLVSTFPDTLSWRVFSLQSERFLVTWKWNPSQCTDKTAVSVEDAHYTQNHSSYGTLMRLL